MVRAMRCNAGDLIFYVDAILPFVQEKYWLLVRIALEGVAPEQGNHQSSNWLCLQVFEKGLTCQ
jgi:hypothetical protein